LMKNGVMKMSEIILYSLLSFGLGFIAALVLAFIYLKWKMNRAMKKIFGG